MLRPFTFFILLFILQTTFAGELSDDYHIAYQTYKEGSYAEAKELAIELLPRAKQENNTFYLVKLYFLLGYLASHTDDYGNSIIYYLEGAQIAEQSDDPELKENLVSMYKNLGWILGDFKHYELSHRFIDQGLKVASALNNENQIKSLLNNRIHELLEEERYYEALHQLDSIQSIFEIKGEALLKMKNKVGIAYKNLGMIDEAKAHYQFVLNNGKETEPKLYASALQNMGAIYLDKEDYDTSLEYYHDQITTLREQKGEEFDQLLFQALELAGRCYYLKGEPDLAIPYLNEAALLDESRDLDPDTYIVYETLSKVYESMGDIDRALHYQSIYTQKLEAFIEEQEKIVELNRKYNIQLLTQQYLDLLSAHQKEQEAESMVKFGLAAITIFWLLLLGLYFKRREDQYDY